MDECRCDDGGGGRRCGRPLRLHLGCGTRRLSGYINVDAREDVEPDIVSDVLKLDWVESGTVDEVYACHVLEHIPNPKVALQEWHRVLMYHGVLRLSVPDMFGIFDAYNAGVHLERLSGLIWGGHKYVGDNHFHGWDFEELAQLLRVCGFFDVRKWWPEAVFPAGYHDISYARVHSRETEEFRVSLNVRGLKI